MNTSRRKRRSWSKEKKLAMLTEAADSSIFQVAKQNDVKPALLYLWRRQFNNSGQDQQTRKQATTDVPPLEREYVKLAKLQAAVAAKLKRDLANGTISSYAAGSTLTNLYNGLSKLESLRNEMAPVLNIQNPIIPTSEDKEKSAEMQRAAEQLLSIYADHIYGKPKYA